MKLGYARVSTEEQSLEAQTKELKDLGCERIFFEKVSAKNRDRKEFKNLLDTIRDGDTIVVTEISRLARSLKDLIFVMDALIESEVKLQIGALKLDFTTPEGKLYARLFAVIAEFEREIISERTKRGLENARLQGRKGGRPKGISEKAMKKALTAYRMRNYGDFKVEEIMRTIEVRSKATYSKYVKKIAREIKEEYGGKLVDGGMRVEKNGITLGKHSINKFKK